MLCLLATTVLGAEPGAPTSNADGSRADSPDRAPLEEPSRETGSSVEEVYGQVADEAEWQRTYVEGLRWKLPIERAPFAVTVLERADIEASGARNLGELLRGVPGIQVYANRSETTVFRAGRANPQTPLPVDLYLDGRPVPITLPGTDFAVPLVLADVERVEIIRSATGVSYGTGGLNLVVLVWTREPADARGTLVESRVTGPLEGYGLTAVQGERVGDFDVKLSAEHEHLETFRGVPEPENDEPSEMLRLALHVAGPVAGGDLDLIGGFSDGSFVASLVGFGIPFEGSDRSVLLRHTTRPGDGTLTVQASYEQATGHDRASSFLIPELELDADILEGSVDYDVRPGSDHRVLAGVRALATRTDDGETEMSTEQLDVFAMDEWEIGRDLVATLGLRFSALHPAGDEWLPSASLLWSPAPDQSLRVVAARGPLEHARWGARRGDPRAPRRGSGAPVHPGDRGSASGRDPVPRARVPGPPRSRSMGARSRRVPVRHRRRRQPPLRVRARRGPPQARSSSSGWASSPSTTRSRGSMPRSGCGPGAG